MAELAASRVCNSAELTQSFVKTGTANVIKNKTKDLPLKVRSKVIISVGLSSCPKCNDEDKSNMLECSWCYRWYHNTCVNIDEGGLEIFTKRKESFPYTCKDCADFARTYLGRAFVTSKLPDAINNLLNKVSLLENQVKVLEQKDKYDENLEFQQAIDKKICIKFRREIL